MMNWYLSIISSRKINYFRNICQYILLKDNYTVFIYSILKTIGVKPRWFCIDSGNIPYQTIALIFRILIFCAEHISYILSIYIYNYMMIDWSIVTRFFFNFIQIYPSNDVMGMKFICNMIISDLFYICWIIKNDCILKLISRFAQIKIYMNIYHSRKSA